MRSGRSRWLPPAVFPTVAASPRRWPLARWVFGAARHFLVTQEGGINPIYKKQILNGSSEDFVRTAYTSGHFARHYRSDVIKAWMASGLDAMPTPYQGNAMDEVRRAAEAANRVDVLHVPGGQVAGMLSEERNNVPAKEIVERMVERGVADFERPAGEVCRSVRAKRSDAVENSPLNSPLSKEGIRLSI